MGGRAGDLQFDRDLDFHRWEWRVKRVAWVGFTLVLIAAGIGATGSGPLAKGRVAASGVEISYDRLLRHGRSTSLKIRAQNKSETMRVRIGAELVERTSEFTIVPEPRSSKALGNALEFEFDAIAGDQPSEVEVNFEPDSAGRMTFEIAVNDQLQTTLRTFIYP